MKSTAAMLLFCCAVLLGTTAPPAAPPENAPPVHVFSCQVVSGVGLVPLTDEIGLLVRFRNDSNADISSIVWRAQYESHDVDFIDDGTFSPATRIDNYVLFELGSTHFDWGGAGLNALALLGHTVPTHSMVRSTITLPPSAGTEDPENCTIVRVERADGSLWLNPAVSQTPPVVPTPDPPPAKGAPTPTPTPTPDPAIPVAVDHCYLTLSGSATLDVQYHVTTPQAATLVTFRAAYDRSALDFTDNGTFSQGARIAHVLKDALPDALRGRQYLDYAPNQCVVANVHFADGTTWQNPAASPSPPPLPTPIPDMLSFGKARWAQRHSYPTPLPSPTPTATSSP